jgi:RNA polymerase sigma-70 factor (ECF subfamily)
MPHAPPAELDELTLARARRGDRAACARFVACYEQRVFAVLSRVLGPSGRAAAVEDLAQETFLRALRALPRFSPGGPARVSTWLLTIATRQALTELRRGGPSTSAMPTEATAGDADRVHARRDLERAIAELTPEQRAVFVLRDAHGFTEVEVAEALEIDVPAVKARLHRARKRLRKFLSHGGES